MGEFSYLAEKIADAEFVASPFRHVYIQDFFTEEHLARIVGDPQVHFGPSR